jgi:hypothetical protein
MTPLMLQDFLVAEMKRLFDGYLLKNSKDELVPLNIYPQHVPLKKVPQKEEFPYLRVFLLDGNDPGTEDSNHCKIFFAPGIFDMGEEKQGYRDVLTIIWRIYEHLKRHVVFDNRYEVQPAMEWRLDPEDRYPYYFGELETAWTVGEISPPDIIGGIEI